MREKLEIRCSSHKVFEPYIKPYPKFVKKWLTHDGDLTKVIAGYLDDPEFKSFFEYLRRQIKYAVSSIKREYSKKELSSADLLTMWIWQAFEPTGEEVGTEYKYPCMLCKAGRMVKDNLILDLRKVSKSADIAKTIAEDEWIVSQRLAEILIDAKLTGFEFRPVKHKAYYEDDVVAIDPGEYSKYPSGRELLEKAKNAGVPYPTSAFWVWLTRSEQEELYQRLRQEYIQMMPPMPIKKRRQLRYLASPWYQLIITSTVKISEETKYGDPFHPNLNSEQFKKPCGHTIDSSPFSELYIKKDSWDGSDIVRTDLYFGGHMKLIYPWPCILITQRFYRVLNEHKIKGHWVEVAHLV